MRDLVITENMSLDGVIAPIDGWFDPGTQDADLSAVVAEHREAADAVVLGRVTYEEFAGFWPHQTNDTTGISAYLDRVAKYVFSSSLERVDWQHTTILRGQVDDELFEDRTRAELTLSETRTFKSGVVLLEYRSGR